MTSQDAILPANTAAALKALVEIMEQTIQAFDNESNALAMNNNTDFSSSSKVKREASLLYQKAAQEFMDREAEFTKHKSPLKPKLVDLTKTLSESTQVNSKLLESVIKASSEKISSVR